MRMNILSSVAQLSDQELLARVKLLAQREREATAVLIAHLAALDERRLYLGEGCSSLFIYCTQVLHLSEHAAYGRIEAARAARRFPIILEMLAEGSVNLTTVGLLAPHLTPENHHELLDAARHQSKRQVEELVARLRPQPLVPLSIRRLPMASPHPPSTTMAGATMPDAQMSAALLDPATGSQSNGDAVGPESNSLDLGILASSCLLPPTPAPSPVAAPPAARPAVVEPLAPERYKVQFTASAEMYAKLRLAQDLLRHQIPDGDLGEIMDRALTALLKNLAKQKFSATDRPRGSHDRESHDRGIHGAVPGSGSVSGSRHIPAGVKRIVWLRDGGRCTFVASNGRRCIERGFLEFHHVVPHSVGGEATVENIQLRCRAHNGYEAELHFGERTALWRRQTSVVKEARASYGQFPEQQSRPIAGWG